jgi:Flavoprotein
VVGDRKVIGLVACAAGGRLATIRDGFVEPALRRGWRVAVTLTPTASRWLSDSEELARIEQATGLPVRDSPRLPHEPRPHPELACCVVAPASANTVAKLALGISDNQALGTANEAIGNPDVPVIVFPRVTAEHIRHPAWAGHLAALRSAGVHLMYGESVYPVDETGQGPPGGRPLPWAAILDMVSQVTSR